MLYLKLDGAEADETMEGERSSNSLLMSVAPDSDIVEDDEISVVLDASKLHLFEADSGDAIAHSVVDTAAPAADSAVAESEGGD